MNFLQLIVSILADDPQRCVQFGTISIDGIDVVMSNLISRLYKLNCFHLSCALKQVGPWFPCPMHSKRIGLNDETKWDMFCCSGYAYFMSIIIWTESSGYAIELLVYLAKAEVQALTKINFVVISSKSCSKNRVC